MGVCDFLIYLHTMGTGASVQLTLEDNDKVREEQGVWAIKKKDSAAVNTQYMDIYVSIDLYDFQKSYKRTLQTLMPQLYTKPQEV